jgi:hypothetical protein
MWCRGELSRPEGFVDLLEALDRVEDFGLLLCPPGADEPVQGAADRLGRLVGPGRLRLLLRQKADGWAVVTRNDDFLARGGCLHELAETAFRFLEADPDHGPTIPPSRHAPAPRDSRAEKTAAAARSTVASRRIPQLLPEQEARRSPRESGCSGGSWRRWRRVRRRRPQPPRRCRRDATDRWHRPLRGHRRRGVSLPNAAWTTTVRLRGGAGPSKAQPPSRPPSPALAERGPGGEGQWRPAEGRLDAPLGATADDARVGPREEGTPPGLPDPPALRPLRGFPDRGCRSRS